MRSFLIGLAAFAATSVVIVATSLTVAGGIA